jgi:hypothetical protein
LPLVVVRLLLVAFYLYFMLGLSFNGAPCSTLLVVVAYAPAALLHEAAPTRPQVGIGVTMVETRGDYSHALTVRLADFAKYATKARGRDGASFREPGGDGTADAGLLKTAS